MRIGLQTWGSEGDVQPFIALAAGLTKAGHSATLIVSDNAKRDYSAYADRYGFMLRNVSDPNAYDPDQLEEFWRKLIGMRNPLRQSELIVKYGFDPLTEAMLDAAKELCATHDAVVGHFFLFPLHIAAEKAGLPLAKVHFTHNCLPSREIHPVGLPKFGERVRPLQWNLTRWLVNRTLLPRINTYRRREGLPLDHDVMCQSWVSSTLTLVGVSPSIVRRPSDWGDRHSVCGFINLPGEQDVVEPPDGLYDFLASGPPPVYFTFGSMMIQNREYIQATVRIWREAVRRLGCRAIFQFPRCDFSLFASGEPVFPVRRSAHATIFPKCAAVVHHGGSGTTQSSLLAGVPSVVVAHIADQFFWGLELERLGVSGRTLSRKQLSAASLARSLSRVLSSPAMAERAAELGASMKGEDGLGNAVKLIEFHLGKTEKIVAV